MLETMTPPKKWWALLVTLTLGFWAGGAAAQSSDDGDWFEEPGESERPRLEIHGSGPYDPPPADFQPAPPSGGPRDRSGDEVAESEEEADDVDIDDGESQQQAVREFSPHLEPYGRWVDDPFYGRVWVPARSVVGVEFRPYVSGGHWELSANDEWLWASDYPFGWVTFHYGRWAWLSGGGWGWVPGYVWAPAWVSYRVGTGGYVGWGPLPPYSVWRGGVFISLGVRRPVPYIFCPTSYVFAPSMPRYIVRDRHRVHSIAAGTYRYRPRYVSRSVGSVRVLSPSPGDARIGSRYIPSRRVVAQPRSAYAATDYRRRVYEKRAPAAGSDVRHRSSGPRYLSEPRQRSEPRYRSSPRQHSEPRQRAEPRQRSEPRYRSAPPVNRSRDVQPRGRSRSSDARDGDRRRTSAAQRGTPAASSRAWRSQAGQNRRDASAAGNERRAAPTGRNEPARYRTPPPPERQRAAPPTTSSERGRGDARRSSGRSAPPPPQRSRDRDDRGRSR